jgi:hypothetical protein
MQKKVALLENMALTTMAQKLLVVENPGKSPRGGNLERYYF